MESNNPIDLVSAALVECQAKLKACQAELNAERMNIYRRPPGWMGDPRPVNPLYVASPDRMPHAEIVKLYPVSQKKCRNLTEYFFNRIYSDTSECWLWRGNIEKAGYGVLKFAPGKAHRLAWELFFGPIPDGLCVLHRCDVRNCVNPDHLFLGTQTENIWDMNSKKRAKPPRVMRGETHPNSKYTDAQIAEIKKVRAETGLSYRLLGLRYGSPAQTIWQICVGKRRKA